VIASETRQGGDLQFKPLDRKGRSPLNKRDKLTVAEAFKRAERFDANFEKRAVAIVECQETDKEDEAGAGPVVDQIQLGLGRAVSISGDVVADIRLAKNLHFFSWKVRQYF
jgi:hypothetical protein